MPCANTNAHGIFLFILACNNYISIPLNQLMRSLLFLVLITVFSGGLSAQRKMTIQKPFGWYEDTLTKLSKVIVNGRGDSAKYEANKTFLGLLKEALSKEGAFDYPFDSITYLGKLVAPDNKFKIFNWHIRRENVTFEYFGYILCHNKAKNKYYVTRLEDKSETIVKGEYAKKLKKDKWYGCHYYSIVGNKKNNSFYTLLGWDGNYYNMNRKIIETVRFNSRGEPLFGGSKIYTKRGSKQRYFIQYSSLASVSLRYDNDLKMIVFDYLVPPHPSMRGRYDKYRPSGFYDAFALENGKWRYKHDIDARAKDLSNKKISQKKIEKENIKRRLEAERQNN